MNEIATLEKLRLEINKHGMLLLNQNKFFPSVIEVGGDWNSILSLIKSREVFLSKAFMNRTTYLSRKMYGYLKHFKQCKPMTEMEERIYNFLSENHGGDTQVLKRLFSSNNKEFKKSMDSLCKNLYVTVLDEGRQLSKEWSSYIWGTYEQWEGQALLDDVKMSKVEVEKRIYETLRSNLTDRQIINLLK